jgi:hypothetical protein
VESQSFDQQSSGPSITGSNFGHGSDWFGFAHPSCTSSDGYAVLQKAGGKYTIINKAPGKGLKIVIFCFT